MEEPSWKKPRKEESSTNAFEADVSVIPRAPQLEQDLSALGVAAFEPSAMERSLFSQYDAALQKREATARHKQLRKLANDRQACEKRLQSLQSKRDAAKDPFKVREIDAAIAKERDKMTKLREEENAEHQLEELERDEENKQQPEREALISAGLITPFEEKRASSKQPQENKFGYMARHGSTMDDTQDEVYAKRLMDWKTGADMNHHADEEDMDVEPDEEPELAFSDEEQDDDANNDLDFDFDEDLNVVDCMECTNTKGVAQVLEVLGLSKLSDCSFDLVSLLRDCRYNAQRAIELIFGDENAVKTKYPASGRMCLHKREKKSVAKPPKRVVPKVMKPEPLPLPLEQIQQLEAGHTASVAIDGNLHVPLEIYDCLFEHQRTGIRWLWELHKQQVGGILADEMGLGKTVQIVCFLSGLLHSGLLSQPVLLICPATVMKQWVGEFHRWAPPFRVIMHHSSRDVGSGSVISREAGLVRALSARGKGVVVTTYEGFRRSKAMLVDVKWSYAILDEGHKIRNPDADITLCCKQLNTHHRIILSGTPIQNSLKELWSLMDFVYPGKLGTLPVFQREFEVPIQIGGYASASPSQVITAFRCSVMLRDLIKPFLLRRLKADVDVFLPEKSEQVMMCRLTPEQVTAYRHWLHSDEVNRILDGKLNALYGISLLRKICNHPDLLKLGRVMDDAEKADYGNFRRSGKMLVLHEMLPMWRDQGHRVLIFSQGVQMLEILSSYLRDCGYSFLSMDGSTTVQSRLPLIERFNNDPSIFAFVLTTRVGGIGVNLTGADRVVIFDPDWNPSTDLQARERAWRIGQKKAVCVYRLVTAGTIEEKILHRQIYKTFLTQKVLKNPRQRRFFNGSDLADLFRLGSEYSGAAIEHPQGSSETSRIFSDMKEKVEDVATKNSDDDVLLRTLLAKNERLVSTLNHEAMVEDQPPEYDILHAEGIEVAKKAVEQLKQSQMQMASAPIHTPTWTGRRGQIGVGPPLFGKTASLNHVPSEGIKNSYSDVPTLSQRMRVVDQTSAAAPPAGRSLSAEKSSDLLSSIRNRGASLESSKDSASSGKQLTMDVCRLLWANNGEMSSADIIEHFKQRLRTVEEKFSFRAILHEVAVLNQKTGIWKIKNEFRNI